MNSVGRPFVQKNATTNSTTSTTSTTTTTTTRAHPTESRSLFHPSLPSAIEITAENQEDIECSLTHLVMDSWRWVSEGFINDDDYNQKRGYFTTYRVDVKSIEPTEMDFKNADIIIVKTQSSSTKKHEKNVFYYRDKKNKITLARCPDHWLSSYEQECLEPEEVEYYLNNHANDVGLPSNPVLRSRQMPFIEVGDWVVTHGKTLRLIKSSDDSIINNLKRQETSTSSESRLVGVTLRADFFNDSYARLAGAYIRRLERFASLKEAFNTFFNVKTIRDSVQISFNGNCRKCCCYDEVTLKDKKLTEDDVRLLYKALGIEMPELDLNSTIVNSVPFKKVLEILTFYNKDYKHPSNVPLLICLDLSTIQARGRGSVKANRIEFLLSVDVGNNFSQLVISREKGIDQKSGAMQYIGNSYTYWFPYWADIDAETADSILNEPFSKSKEIIKNLKPHQQKNLIEFLACTQIVEAHITPNYLEKSRLPGAGKHARSIIRKAKEEGKRLADYFHSDNLDTANEFFPMAGNKGTANGRNAVNTLNRINKDDIRKINSNKKITSLKRETDNNAPDYYMSDDSEVDFF